MIDFPDRMTYMTLSYANGQGANAHRHENGLRVDPELIMIGKDRSAGHQYSL